MDVDTTSLKHRKPTGNITLTFCMSELYVFIKKKKKKKLQKKKEKKERKKMAVRGGGGKKKQQKKQYLSEDNKARHMRA